MAFLTALAQSLLLYSSNRMILIKNSAFTDTVALVIRDNTEKIIPVGEIVVGDIVKVNQGQIMCFDGVVLNSNGLICDESLLTGENKYVNKSAEVPFLLKFCKILKGDAKVLVVAVGENTFFQKALQENEIENIEEIENTPLHEYACEVAEKIGYWAILVSFLVFLIYFANLIKKLFAGEEIHLFTYVVTMLIKSVSVIYIGTPEGLLIILMLFLSFVSVKNVKIKNLVGLENTQYLQNVITHKTGILTLNLLKIGKMHLETFRPNTDPLGISQEVLQVLIDHISYNSTSVIASFQDSNKKEKTFGNNIEIALLKQVKNWKMPSRNGEVLIQIPFDKTARIMTTLVRVNDKILLFVKGCPEKIISFCRYEMMQTGEIRDFTLGLKENAMNSVKKFGETGCKSIAFAVRYLDSKKEYTAEDVKEFLCEMQFQGILAVKDLVRPDVNLHLAHCNRIGINVRLATGDHISAAIYYAQKSGILESNSSSQSILSGEQFTKQFLTTVKTSGKLSTSSQFELTDATLLLEIITPLRVLFQCSPIDKYCLISALQLLKENTAVVGCGPSDFEVCKKADFVIGLEVTSCELIKKSADIVLENDGIDDLINAVFMGNAMKETIRNYVKFIIIGILGYCYSVLISSTLGGDGLSIIQSLWISLVFYVAAPVVIISRERKIDLEKNGIIERKAAQYIFMQIAHQTIWATIVILAYFCSDFGEYHFSTISFQSYCFLQFFNMAKCSDSLSSLTTIQVLTLVLTLAIQLLSGSLLAFFFNCSPLTLLEFLCCLLPSLSSMFFTEFSNFLPSTFFKSFLSIPISPSKKNN